MNISLSLKQISRTGILDAKLISRRYKLSLMVDFMRLKYEKSKLKQSEIANQLGYSTSILQRYRKDINMLSLYRIQPNNTNKRPKKASNACNSHRDLDVKRPQMTLNDLKTTQTNTKINEINKNVLKAGSMQENIEINEHYSDEILDINDIYMGLTMQIISTDRTVRIDTIEDIKEFTFQFLTTQSKKGEQLVSMMPAIRKDFTLGL